MFRCAVRLISRVSGVSERIFRVKGNQSLSIPTVKSIKKMVQVPVTGERDLPAPNQRQSSSRPLNVKCFHPNMIVGFKVQVLVQHLLATTATSGVLYNRILYSSLPYVVCYVEEYRSILVQCFGELSDCP